MSHRSESLFHTRISSLLDIYRLLPSRVISDMAGMRLALGSKEGFIRQILGWREFVRHVHESTDGFRKLPGGKTPTAKAPGDGGYGRWVVEPNVLGMGTYALAGLMTTKPYVSGPAYINRMSDYCTLCPFNPKTDCPFTSLYWAFLARHEAVLRTNPRLRMPMASLGKREASRRKQDQEVYKRVGETLRKGDKVTPQKLP